MTIPAGPSKIKLNGPEHAKELTNLPLISNLNKLSTEIWNSNGTMDKVNKNTQLPNLTDMKFQLKETLVTSFSFNILVMKILNTMKITTLKKLLLKLLLNTESILKLALKFKFIISPKTETKLLFLSYLWLITN